MIKIELVGAHDAGGVTRAHLRVHCGKNAQGYCDIPVRSDVAKQRVWYWNGIVDKPTVTPSIWCNGPGGCGLHINVVDGEARNG